MKIPKREVTMSDTWTSISAPYVRPRAAGQQDAWAEEAAQHGGTGRQALREVAEIPAPADVAEALDVPAGQPVVVRRRTILFDEQPVELADSYYPAAIARGTGLAESGKIRGGAVTLLADLGYQSRRVIEDVCARPATESERELLRLDEGEWVLVLTRVSATAEGVPFEAATMTMIARGRHMRYEMSV
ncbi:GntR family transcriptional regulator [Planobispora siamensis]|uniref:UbiC transcription regulator-associated domain-containing protein n=1 Tax=Planobispora siamensis TaxID=936338 RepID=A0A8J3SF43_9ACTN|nr:UTRA domain-containing protein [Planobispora siamensis]GIH91905.1 hypothetical protein Psi01_25350 [Planobispora siamensis]